MGIINWLKDKVILRMEHDIAMLSTRCEGLDLQMAQLKSQLASVRTLASRGKSRRSEEDGDEDDEDDGSPSLARMTPEMRAFYESTIEFQQAKKYKNLENQKK